MEFPHITRSCKDFEWPEMECGTYSIFDWLSVYEDLFIRQILEFVTWDATLNILLYNIV